MSVWPVFDGGMKEVWKGRDWEIWLQFNNFIWQLSQLSQQAVDTKMDSWDKQQQREQSFLSFAPAIPVLDFI